MAGHELDEPARPPLEISTSGDSAPTRHLRDRIVELLGPSPVTVDEIVRTSGASASEVQIVMLDLELEGLIERHGGALVSMSRKI